MDDISEERLREYKEAFEMFDKENKGSITAKELENAMRSLNYEPTEKDLEEMISEIDENGDGMISFEEFVTLMHRRVKESDSEEEVINAFRVFDRENRGLISVAELTHILTTLGDKLTEEEVQEMIREADIDGDGYINYEEFVRLMMAK